VTVLPERLSVGAPARADRKVGYVPVAAFVLDVATVVAACVLAALVRNHVPIFGRLGDVSDSVQTVCPILVAGWVALIWAFGGYRGDVFGGGADEFKRVFTASLYAVALLCAGCYLAKYALSRGFFVIVACAGVPALLAVRLMLRRALQAARSRGAFRQRVLIVGGPHHIDAITAVLRRERWLGYSVVGALTPSTHSIVETATGVPILGASDDPRRIPALLDGVDIIFFAGGAPFAPSQLRQLQWDLEQHHVQMVVAPSLTDISAERVQVRPVGGLPLMHLEAPRWAHAGRWMKRSFDMIGSTLLILATLPLIVVAAVQIKLHDGGPVFFRQTRVGRDGTEFGCLKFRTMVVDAEARIAALIREQGSSALLFKMKDDPRITKPGRWLRRFSVDELPQLFNVLFGDMSLIGPRPQVPREVALYDDALRRRLRVRPGMTGLWQVSGRNDLSVEESTRLDLYYVDNWSMLQDLNILAKTFFAVVRSRGAY